MTNRHFKTRFIARVLFFLAIMLGLSMSMIPYRLEFVRMEASGDQIAPPQVPTKHVLVAEVSAYTSRPEETDDTPTITASGDTVRDGGIACPARYKFGTSVEIAGKIYTCNDRMHARYRDSNNFDIWFSSVDEAMQFGRQKIVVIVLDGEKEN